MIVKLHTNEGDYYVERVTEKTLRKRMCEYIREKRASGMSLACITYCWHPIHVQRKLP